ncbi:L-Aspartase-like protein [Rhypophila decipiens]|uniref:L-Aspartase-like protein n=1 Tax=Rhypophila decipiens TaxID=261697 RepID=A0AAN7B9M6_9PEZI|nr:L-Aspartase-like protein [Rhypophila decipiens]
MGSMMEPAPVYKHASETYSQWATWSDVLEGRKNVSLTGSDLSIGDVVAVSRTGVGAQVAKDPKVLKRVQDSVDFLANQIENGAVIYGVNTGFGGSADTRTKLVERLQSAAVQHLNAGIVLQSDKGKTSASDNELLRSHALPNPISRAAMLVRCNSLLRGHSGVRLSTIDSIMALISNNMTPVIPLRGSISASGDLSTLSFIAGAIEGNPDVFVRVAGGSGVSEKDMIVPADQALQLAGIDPVRLQAKEGLGITNGTAPSCATACIVIHQANQLALLTQLLTAMGTEALAGTAHNYHPFISAIRPHAGQTEAAANILAFLSGSKISSDRDPDRIGLAQDRYPLRTAPQWIGPQLEDLLLATRQVAVELNSTTDNPLIDAEDSRVHHGGNFQAMAITSAMEKTMTAVQNLGRLLFTQSSELINNMTNKGLPPNLSADDPSESFICKGFDVNMAAYMAELAYLAHPVSTHVQMAEMTNQAVNSMALVSARYALEAVEVLSLMAAVYMYTLCQGVDLRVLQIEWRKRFPLLVHQVLGRTFKSLRELAFYENHGMSGGFNGTLSSSFSPLVKAATSAILTRWDHLSHLDTKDRARTAVGESLGTIITLVSASSGDGNESFASLQRYTDEMSTVLAEEYLSFRATFVENPVNITREYLAPATRVIYDLVRTELGIPMNRGVVDHPPLVVEAEREAAKAANGNGHVNGEGSKVNRKRTLGSMAGEIYEALRRGDVMSRVMEWGAKEGMFVAGPGASSAGF